MPCATARGCGTTKSNGDAMTDRTFVRYVGNPDFHDGRIVDVQENAGAIRVQIRGASGRTYVAEFPGGRIVTSNRPVGMLLYGLSEMTGEPPFRRFAFANWDEEDDAALEIDATDLNVLGISDAAADSP